MSSQINESEIWAEMARRKLQFHPNDEWQDIKLWGLFKWGEIKRQRDNGELLYSGYSKTNKIVWCAPSKEAWENKIKPLIEKYSLEQLTQMAGW